MATAVAKLGAVIQFTQNASVTVFEGDVIENLVYTSGNTQKTISGQIRVINATTRANNKIPDSCPPEPYVHRYITINSMTIDSSDVYDAEMTRINISDIVSIGSVNGNEISCAVAGECYATLDEAIAAAQDGDTITILSDTEGSINIPAGKNLTIEGVTPETVLTGGIVVAGTGDTDMSLTVRNITLDGNNATEFGILCQNDTADGQFALDLTLETVNFQNYTVEAVKATNGRNVVINNGSYQNAAKGAYAIEFYLIAVQDSDIKITSCKFDGSCGTDSVIAVAQRGGPSDSGVPAAKIASLTVQNCAFVDDAAAVDVTIGTNNFSTGKTAKNTSGDFAATIGANQSAAVVRARYQDSVDEPDGPTIIIPSGKSISKTATTDFVMLKA